MKELMEHMGSTEDEREEVSEQMAQMMENADGEEGFQPGGALPLSFMQGLFPGMNKAAQDNDDGDMIDPSEVSVVDEPQNGGNAQQNQKTHNKSQYL